MRLLELSFSTFLSIISFTSIRASNENDICVQCSCEFSHVFCEGAVDLSALSMYDGLKVTSLVIIGVQEGNLSENDFTKFKDVSELELESNKVRIDSAAFQGLSKIINLSLRNNSIATISASMFQTNRKLIYIDLSENQIQRLDGGTFSHLNRLMSMNLSNNQISRKLDNEVFTGLSSLEELDLSRNQIKRLEANTFLFLTSAKKLLIADNLLEHAEPGAFAGLSVLEELDLRGNRLERLEATALAPLTRLRVLRLENNRLASFGLALLEVLARPGLTASLQGNPLLCACGELHDAWAAAAARGLRLALTCASGQPWDTAMKQLKCDTVPFTDSKVIVSTIASETVKRNKAERKSAAIVSATLPPKDAGKNNEFLDSINTLEKEIGASIEFIVLLLLICVVAAITTCVVISLFVVHFRLKKAAEEYQHLKSATSAYSGI